jgi:hypothetical protein
MLAADEFVGTTDAGADDVAGALADAPAEADVAPPEPDGRAATEHPPTSPAIVRPTATPQNRPAFV